MSKVHLPYLMIGTEFSTLPEELFNSIIIVLIPVDFSLGHKCWYVFFKCFIELLKTFFDSFSIVVYSGVLYFLGKFS